MNTLTIALVIATLVAGTVAILLASRRLGYNISLYGPLLIWRSEYGIDLADRIANKAPRFWKVWGVLGLLTAGIGMVLSIALIATTATKYLVESPPATTPLSNPKNALIIPGFNDFLPLDAAPEIAFALAIGLIVHEGGHAIYCRLSDMDIDSTGLLFLSFIPLGAFVDPDSESLEEATPRSRLPMFAAGIMNNMALSIICLVLLFGPVMMVISPAPGVAIGGVAADSPAEAAGIEGGDRVTAVNGTEVENPVELEEELSKRSVSSVTIDGEREIQYQSALFVTEVNANFNVSPGDTITHVDGKEVSTPSEYLDALPNKLNTTITVNGDESHQLTRGTPVKITADSPAARAGLPSGEDILIVSIGDTPVYTPYGLKTTLENAGPNSEVQVVVQENETVKTYNATLSPAGKLGVSTYPEEVIDVSVLGVKEYPAHFFDSVLSYGSGEFSLIQRFLGLLALPALQASSVASFSFAGFTPAVANFYSVSIGGAFMRFFMLTLASTLFWTAWIGINIAFFNCIPTYALDGGHIVGDTIDSGLDLIPADVPDWLPRVLTHLVKAGLAVGLFVLLFGPVLL